MFDWSISRKTTDACVPVQHIKQEVCNPWFNTNWKTILSPTHHHLCISIFPHKLSSPIMISSNILNVEIPKSQSPGAVPTPSPGSPRAQPPWSNTDSSTEKSRWVLFLSYYHSKPLKNSSNSFSRRQDNDGDVLYVWTTLNLRAEHGFGNLYNQTYVLGDYHERWRGHVWTWKLWKVKRNRMALCGCEHFLIWSNVMIITIIW